MDKAATLSWCLVVLPHETHTWYDGPQHGATTENTIRYMDFAAKNNFGGVLVEGWNPDWKSWNFDYVHPYKILTLHILIIMDVVKELHLLAIMKRVGELLIMKGRWKMHLNFIGKNGMHYVKTGYVGDLTRQLKNTIEYSSLG